MKLYVGNLPEDLDDAGLAALFAPHGTVVTATVMCDPQTGAARGFGYVEMEDDGARLAIDALDGTDLDGVMLRVNESRDRGQKAPRRPW